MTTHRQQAYLAWKLLYPRGSWRLLRAYCKEVINGHGATLGRAKSTLETLVPLWIGASVWKLPCPWHPVLGPKKHQQQWLGFVRQLHYQNQSSLMEVQVRSLYGDGQLVDLCESRRGKFVVSGAVRAERAFPVLGTRLLWTTGTAPCARYKDLFWAAAYEPLLLAVGNRPLSSSYCEPFWTITNSNLCCQHQASLKKVNTNQPSLSWTIINCVSGIFWGNHIVPSCNVSGVAKHRWNGCWSCPKRMGRAEVRKVPNRKFNQWLSNSGQQTGKPW